MPEVTLHILDAGVILNVCRRSAPECLVSYTGDASLFRQRLQVPFQIVPNAERGSGRTRKEESAAIIPVRMPRDPRFDLALQVRRHRNEVVALIRFCVTNPVFSSLTFLESLIDSKLGTLEIFDAQDQNLGRPQSAHPENPQYDMLTGRSMRQQRTEFLQAEEPFTRFLADLGHHEFARRALGNEIFIYCIFKARLHIRANLSHDRLAESGLR